MTIERVTYTDIDATLKDIGLACGQDAENLVRAILVGKDAVIREQEEQIEADGMAIGVLRSSLRACQCRELVLVNRIEDLSSRVRVLELEADEENSDTAYSQAQNETANQGEG